MLENPVGLDGMDFIEFAGPDVNYLKDLFQQMGLTKVGQHKKKQVSLWRQNDVTFLLNEELGSFAEQFMRVHGPSICSTGFRCKNAKEAQEIAVSRGARPFEGSYDETGGKNYPAVYGIGDSLIYFVDNYGQQNSFDEEFDYVTEDRFPKGYGLMLIDHLTNNVPKGEMDKWCEFYNKVFNFTERRFFDIRGEKTGLISKVMRSPCEKITIPINEPTEDKSQIQEYLDEYKGSGIQHLALLTEDILDTTSRMRSQGIGFLDTPDTYYEVLKERVPNVTEAVHALQERKILVDGDSNGYLLQIFTQNIVGPIFLEIIQRKKHDGFGEGNFQALFDAIERDQEKRGYI